MVELLTYTITILNLSFFITEFSFILISFRLFVRKGKQKNYISVFNLQIVLYVKHKKTKQKNAHLF
jgi:hypothetical protein